MTRRPKRHAVVHSEERTGARGGLLWWLTLDCGHHRLVYQCNPRDVRKITAPVRFAPHFLKCVVCEPLRAPEPIAAQRTTSEVKP